MFTGQAAGFVGVAAVVADQVFALVGDVLGELCEEVEGVEDLEVAGDPSPAAEKIFAGGFGVLLAVVFLGLVEDLAFARDANESGEREGAAGHVLGEAFDGGTVAAGEEHGAVDVEAAVPPGAHLVDEGGFDETFIEQEAEDLVLPEVEEGFVGEVEGDGMEVSFGGEGSLGDQAMKVGVEVDEVTEGLDGDDAAGGGVFAEEGLVDFADGLPGEGGEFVEQVAMEAEEGTEAFGDGPDELAMGDELADIVGNIQTE